MFSCGAVPATAQTDRVFPLTGSPTVGKITDISPQAVIVESSGGKQTLTVDKIRSIRFDGEPSTLTKGREFALDGQYEQALEELSRIDFSAIRRDAIKADAMFFLARSEAGMALIGRGNLGEATRKLSGFATANRQSIHFFGAAKLLGDLAIASGNFDQALRFYAALSQSPAPDLKIEAEYLMANAKLRQGNAEEAEAGFAKVIAADVQSTAAARLQTLAKAGQAVTFARQGKGQQGLEQVNSLITQLDPGDSEMAAQIYNAQGASFEAIDDAVGAVLAYLHTHLMFSGQAAAHAEALSRLVELWPQVGNPQRANEARQELQQRYPGWKK